jgi:hypothetical protein
MLITDDSVLAPMIPVSEYFRQRTMSKEPLARHRKKTGLLSLYRSWGQDNLLWQAEGLVSAFAIYKALLCQH